MLEGVALLSMVIYSVTVLRYMYVHVLYAVCIFVQIFLIEELYWLGLGWTRA